MARIERIEDWFGRFVSFVLKKKAIFHSIHELFLMFLPWWARAPKRCNDVSGKSVWELVHKPDCHWQRYLLCQDYPAYQGIFSVFSRVGLSVLKIIRKLISKFIAEIINFSSQTCNISKNVLRLCFLFFQLRSFWWKQSKCRYPNEWIIRLVSVEFFGIFIFYFFGN